MNDNIPVTEADLHAYLDNQLSHERRNYVDQWLAKNPQELLRLNHYKTISIALKNKYNSVAEEPVPDKFLEIAAKFKKKQRFYQPLNFATLLGMFLLGITVGWYSKPIAPIAADQSLVVHLVKPAAFAHTIYASDKIKPVEFSAKQEARLTHWLSDRMHTSIKPPVLLKYGYQFVGGRLIPSTNRMAALFMYENREGKRITLYVRRVNSFQFKKEQREIRFASEPGISTLFWRQGEMGFALSGDPDNKTLSKAANTARVNNSI